MQTTSSVEVACPHCGGFHKTTCPRIKMIEYENGLIKRIEFFPQGQAGYGTPPVQFATHGSEH